MKDINCEIDCEERNCKMDYKLEIEPLFEEGDGSMTVMYSKGHQDEQKFKKACYELYAEHDYEVDIEKEPSYKFIDDAKVRHWWGKKVGWFEDNERKGYTLSESREKKKGCFPMTIMYID